MISYNIYLWFTSLSMVISRSIHVAANGIISFFFYGWVVFCCIYLPRILYPFISDNAFKGVLSYFPRPHQSVGLSEGTCYSNPQMSLSLAPTLPQLPLNYFWCSHGIPCGLMKALTGLLTSTFVITTKVPMEHLLCPAPQGSETRAWHVADA